MVELSSSVKSWALDLSKLVSAWRAWTVDICLSKASKKVRGEAAYSCRHPGSAGF